MGNQQNLSPGIAESQLNSTELLFPTFARMNSDEIEKFLTEKTSASDLYVKIDFKKRDTIYGLFVRDKDYGDLKSKNFWRIVTRTHFDEYNKSKNLNLAKIFNGAEFSRLSLLSDGF